MCILIISNPPTPTVPMKLTVEEFYEVELPGHQTSTRQSLHLVTFSQQNHVLPVLFSNYFELNTRPCQK